MDKTRVEKKTLRILQRTDGAIFGFSLELETRSDMIPGWKIMYEDGTAEIKLDSATTRQLDTSNTSKREQALINENARLKEQLAKYQGIGRPVQSVAVLEAGETPIIPIDDSNFTDLTLPAELEDEEEAQAKVPSAVENMSKTALMKLRRDDLVDRLKLIDPQAVVLEDDTRPFLIEKILKIQG